MSPILQKFEKLLHRKGFLLSKCGFEANAWEVITDEVDQACHRGFVYEWNENHGTYLLWENYAEYSSGEYEPAEDYNFIDEIDDVFGIEQDGRDLYIYNL